MDLVGVGSFRVEDGLGVVEDYEHLFGGKDGPKGSQVLGVFDLGTDDLRESGKEMGTGSRKLIAADESTVIAESFFDSIVMEDRESNGCLSDSACADESDGLEAFDKSGDLLNQLISSETVPRRWGR